MMNHLLEPPSALRSIIIYYFFYYYYYYIIIVLLLFNQYITEDIIAREWNASFASIYLSTYLHMCLMCEE